MCDNNQCGCKKHGTDSSDKDSPTGLILSYVFHMPEGLLSLPIEEFKEAVDRQLNYMTHQLKAKAEDHWVERQVDKDFPTEFTRP